MSKAATKSQLREALERAGSAWIFRFWGNDAEKNLGRVAADLQEFATEYERRFGERPDPLALLSANPFKGAAFFQVDTLMVSLEMKIMIWRILLGCEIAKVDFKYRAGEETALIVTLRAPYKAADEIYESAQPADFRVLRHFGATGANGQLFLQGYYAAKGTGALPE